MADISVNVQQGAAHQVTRCGAEDGRGVEGGWKGAEPSGPTAPLAHLGEAPASLPSTPALGGNPFNSSVPCTVSTVSDIGQCQPFKVILKHSSQSLTDTPWTFSPSKDPKTLILQVEGGTCAGLWAHLGPKCPPTPVLRTATAT